MFGTARRMCWSRAALGAWLAEQVPGATVVVDDGQGHMSDLDRVVELTTWLVKGT
jgi:hypothetical protein